MPVSGTGVVKNYNEENTAEIAKLQKVKLCSEKTGCDTENSRPRRQPKVN